ncbi:hypothetical protein [Bradyrhizobium sp. B117]|uniref:hypothetical protein n=1 Tax=Bradyrhizobium sp. B117 TaxID=3140246 RepID=UPI003183D2D5
MARDSRRPSVRRSAASEVVPFCQVEQAPLRERIRLLRQVPRPLREAPVEIFHDATPRNITENPISAKPPVCTRAASLRQAPQAHCYRALIAQANNNGPPSPCGGPFLNANVGLDVG